MVVLKDKVRMLLRRWLWRLRPDQYGPEGERCSFCRKQTYGDADACFCVHCGVRLPLR